MRERGYLVHFYPLQWVASVVSFDEIRGVDLVSWLPCVVAFRIAFPFEEVLELSGASMTSVAPYLFYFVFFFSADEVRWWMGEIWAMCSCLIVGR